MTPDRADNAPNDLSPEQLVMVAVLQTRGHTRDDALATVRADRVASYGLGSHLLPPLVKIAKALTEAFRGIQ